MARSNSTYVVIGLGAFGSTVAQELARFGNHVMGVDIEEKPVSRLADTLTASAILDTTDDTAMREAGIDQYDVALVAIGTDIQSSILTTMNLRLLGIDRIWVKAANRTHHRILSKLGADRVILPEQEMGRHTAQMLNNPAMKDYMSLGNGYSVVNIVLPERLDGCRIGELELEERPDMRLLGIMRGTEFRDCTNPDSTMQKDDRLILVGKRGDLRAFGEEL
ncbi:MULTISPECIES: potassium channel family protein [Salipiger]|uniref:Trk system potassium uptake protein TrkA n=1 Tax=Salipiger profundus TaxID=1229727 RepID=A0A1U7DAC8_9RHOB|nr:MULTISPECIES: TrkA family potassium uptake protein [Salipiger]APX25020.1 trk system potassium uptake protein TrkA [Salipiger profundus]GGA14875.1 potassium transporter KtrA [Salipiger profundus]SFD12746.1 trk system potassium uptake protein TrkA [Salipiger profundus]